MICMDQLLTLVINLDRAPERLQRVSQQLQRVGLSWVRLPAVDARVLSPEQNACLDAPAYRRKHGMEPLAGELGCYLSHVEAMRRLLASDAAYALVLEDDVLVTDRLPAALAGLMAQPARFHCCKTIPWVVRFSPRGKRHDRTTASFGSENHGRPAALQHGRGCL